MREMNEKTKKKKIFYRNSRSRFHASQRPSRPPSYASRLARSLSIISSASPGLHPPWTPPLVASAGTCLLGGARTEAFLPADPRSNAAAAATSSAPMLRTEVVLDVPLTAEREF